METFVIKPNRDQISPGFVRFYAYVVRALQ